MAQVPIKIEVTISMFAPMYKKLAVLEIAVTAKPNNDLFGIIFQLFFFNLRCGHLMSS